MEALLGLFAASFAAATLFPLPSEAALFAYLQVHPDQAMLAVAVAFHLVLEGQLETTREVAGEMGCHRRPLGHVESGVERSRHYQLR